MSVLAWIDTVERLDTLILEIRHVQCNILHFLRLPDLYGPLRFEEAYLWGACGGSYSWFEVFTGLREPDKQLAELARAWVIRYPPRRPAVPRQLSEWAAGFTDKIGYDHVAETACAAVRCALDEGGWNDDARRLYLNLCELQTLKSNILRDKLVLCLWGYRTVFRLCPQPRLGNYGGARSKGLGTFMIVRSAVSARIQRFVERLGDLQAQLERSLDLSLQDDPPPIRGRRQEQGFYNSYLLVRCRELQENLDDLLYSLGAPGDPDDDALLMHRWIHDFTSSAQRFHDELYPDRHGGPDPLCGTAHFINSSYWMPDRPDLISMISHELSHNALKTRLHNLESPSLDLLDDPVSRLSKLFYACFSAHRIPSRMWTRTHVDAQMPGVSSGYAVLEIVSDLLAASVEGPAFLYTAFLELSASSIGDLLVTPGDNFDLDLSFRLEESVDPKALDYSWYLRLHLLCAWLRATHHREASPVVMTLIEGTEAVAESVLSYLGELSRYPQLASSWRNLRQDLCQIATTAQAASEVRRWRKRRSREARPTASGDTSSSRVAPRFVQRLGTPIRNFLFCMLLHNKVKPGHLLNPAANPRALGEKFVEKYLGGSFFAGPFLAPEGDENVINADTPIFLHLYDIPWECAIFRGIDYVHQDARVPDWLKAFHCQAALGREIYEIGMEWYLWQTRSPEDRLAAVVRVVRRAVEEDCPSLDAATATEIVNWLGPHPSAGSEEDKQDPRPAKQLYDEIEAHRRSGDSKDNDRHNRWLAATATKYSARILRAAGDSIFPGQVTGRAASRRETARTIGALQGHKLAQLLGILHDLSALPWPWPELRYYLTLRQAPREFLSEADAAKRHPDEQDEKSTVSHLIQAFDILYGSTDNHMRSSCLYQLARFAVVSDNRSQLATPRDYPPHLLLEGAACKVDERGVLHQITLGRFDLMTLHNAPPMLRASLPSLTKEPGGRDERFLPFICRREQAIPCRLDLNKPWPLELVNDPDKPVSPPPQIAAFLSVLLVDRSARLSFLARLLGGWLKNGDEYCSFERASEWLRNKGAWAFLSEGWGDLVICVPGGRIGRDGGVDDVMLSGIFDVQDSMYNDFQVERTELVLTPICLKPAASSPNFEIVMHFRIRPDRDMRRANEIFEENVLHAVQPERIIQFGKLPGTTDYSLRLHWGDMFDQGQAGLALLGDAIREADDMVTLISRKVVGKTRSHSCGLK